MKNLRKQIARYSEQIAENPDDATHYAARAAAYTALGDTERALADHEQVITLTPEDPVAYYRRGCLYLNLFEYDQAGEDFHKATELKFGYAEAHFVGYVADMMERGADAHKRSGIRSAKTFAHFVRGRDLYGELKKYDEAIADFGKVIEDEPDYAEAYHCRGVFYAVQNHYARAMTDLNKAAALAPDDAEILCSRGLVQSQQGQYEKAVADFDEAIKQKKPGLFFLAAYSGRGLAYLRQQKYDDAIADFGKVIAFAGIYSGTRLISRSTDALGLFSFAYYHRGFAYLQSGKPNRTAEDYGKAIQLTVNVTELYYQRGAVLEQLGREKEAVADFNRANALKNKLHSDFTEIFRKRGETYRQHGEYRKTVECFNKAFLLEFRDYFSNYIFFSKNQLPQLRTRWDRIKFKFARMFPYIPTKASEYGTAIYFDFGADDGGDCIGICGTQASRCLKTRALFGEGGEFPLLMKCISIYGNIDLPNPTDGD